MTTDEQVKAIQALDELYVAVQRLPDVPKLRELYDAGLALLKAEMQFEPIHPAPGQPVGRSRAAA